MDPQVVSPINIVVVDDHGIVRDGVCALLDGHFHIKVIGSIANGKDAIRFAERLKPDVMVMDLVLPELSGIEATLRVLAIVPSRMRWRPAKGFLSGVVVNERSNSKMTTAGVALS
jgi:DNA-binding NarL/FixJ family response regulator